ncbi:MAG TPA: hypothetical protein VHQ01_10150 [Pyrinomonadaceae bacterium]|nr:hypothetical protein [Pyrinomonadaceae bacterium]
MNFQKSFIERIVVISLFVVIFSAITAAQGNNKMPLSVIDAPKRAMDVAGRNNMYCAGYIQSSPMSTENKLIGARDEMDKFNFSQNDFLYINVGKNKGANVGDVFAVVRPRAQVKSRWSNKNDLGYYVQEVGAVEVVRVNPEYSVARVKTSCDSFMLADLVQLVEKRTSPVYTPRPALDIFSSPSGKAEGRILMARDGAEFLTRDYIVYVDLGADNNVRVGDHLTIFRPLGKGNLFLAPHRESVGSSDYGYQSDVYQGGKFSNQAARKSGDRAEGKEISSKTAKEDRPADLRKVVGEAVVLNVKEKTATVVITRTAQEIHTGDWVEIQ